MVEAIPLALTLALSAPLGTVGSTLPVPAPIELQSVAQTQTTHPSTDKHDKIVKIVLLSGLGALSVYDIQAAARGSHDTVSQITWNAWKAHPWILFLAGYICGHLFWGK